MRALLVAWPQVAALLAAVDTFLVRRALMHRPLEPRTFLEIWALWLCFALVALLPAWLWLRLARRARDGAERPTAARAYATLAFWTAAPVVAHQRLDDYTRIGGNIAALKAAKPWLEVGVALFVLALLCFLLATLARRLLAARLALLLGLPALLAGLFLPGHFGPRPSPAVVGSAGGRPNLLLLVWDTTRSPSLAPYGYARETTPALASFAARSVLFETARSVSCFTLTSHLSMLTGVYPSEHGARMTRMVYDGLRTPSIAVALRAAGYRTGGFVGTDVLRASTGMADGFERYSDRVDPRVCESRAWSLVHDVQAILAAHVPACANNGLPHWFQDFQRPAEEVLAEAREWIENGDERPWFCFVNLYDAHWPYLPDAEQHTRWVEPYAGMVDGYLFRSDAYHRPSGVKRGSRLVEADRKHLRELYDAELAELDRKVGDFLAVLDLDGGRTGAILTSDHGEAFGEGGRYEHDDILEAQVRVPLLVHSPDGAGAGTRRALPSSGIDVATTLIALAGLERPAHCRGLDLLGSPDDPERHVLIEDRDKLAMEDGHLALYEGPWKLVVTGLGAEGQARLYDWRRDPEGLEDLSASEPALRARLLTALQELRHAWGGESESWGGVQGLSSRGLGALGYTGEGEDEGQGK